MLVVEDFVYMFGKFANTNEVVLEGRHNVAAVEWNLSDG